MAQAHAAYLLPPNTTSWSDKLFQCAAQKSDVFWTGSREVAPLETLLELDVALNKLVEGGGPNADWPWFIKQLSEPSRCHQRLSQLHSLLSAIDILPDQYQMMADLLKTDQPPIRLLQVYRIPDFPELNSWQEAVLTKLAKDAPPPDDDLQILIIHALETVQTSRSSLLAARSLYQASDERVQPDDSLQVMAVRDRLEEIEVVAGMIQKALNQGSDAFDFGILLPHDEFTLQTAEMVFTRCGLPLSGMDRSTRQRDLGKEVVRLLLLCLRKPAPIMSITALLTSPLMPWPVVDGHDYAQAVMNGDVLLKKCKLEGEPKRLMDLVGQGADMPTDLQKHLNAFKRLLKSEDSLPDHRQRALACVDVLLNSLKGMVDLQWETLLSATRPESLHKTGERNYWQEGIAVFHEGREPWRTVKNLLVIGFNDGHFPGRGRASAVLTEAEWEDVSACGWPVSTAEITRKRRRDLFARQISAATDRVTILFSRRDNAGDAMEPSSSLVFLARRFGLEPEGMIVELDRQDERKKIPELAIAPDKKPTPPRDLPISDIELNLDLLAAFSPVPGELAPLSPSAADTLMVSPFAWLLGRLGCSPREWVTDTLDPMTAGTLAHGVFEALFPSDQPLINVEDIQQQAPTVLRQLTLQLAPFLRSPDWRVERLKLESEIVQAAVRWRSLLDSWGAMVVAAEQWLKGHYNIIPIRGQCDLVLELPTGKLLVVDYKKSSSGKRRSRMRSRFDLQAHLYRLMIQTGGLPALGTTPADIGVVYYLMNDLTALADSTIPESGKAPGLEILNTDISSQALTYLDKRLVEIRAGKVCLNTTEDETWWDKNAHIKIYALDNSPLLRLFMHAGEGKS